MKRLNVVPVTIIMIAVFTTLSMITYAQPFRDGRGGGHGFEMLELTDAQEKQIEDLHTVNMQEMLNAHNQIKVKEAELNVLQSAKKVDMKAVEAKIKEISVIKTEMEIKRANTHNEVRNILTDEQRVKFDMHHANRPRGNRGEMNGRHGRGNCDGNGPRNGKGNGRGNGNGYGNGNGGGNR